jgi:hypothetical protein
LALGPTPAATAAGPPLVADLLAACCSVLQGHPKAEAAAHCQLHAISERQYHGDCPAVATEWIDGAGTTSVPGIGVYTDTLHCCRTHVELAVGNCRPAASSAASPPSLPPACLCRAACLTPVLLLPLPWRPLLATPAAGCRMASAEAKQEILKICHQEGYCKSPAAPRITLGS